MKTFLLLTICTTLLSGCGRKSGATLDAADEKDARVRQGLALAQQNDLNGAVKQFEAALAKKPELGRPDLELAIIYQQNKNYARAIYHYERYLEKRPSTEKRPLIQEWIKQAKVSLAGEVGGTEGDLSEQLVRLTRENNMLRKQLETAGGGGAVPVSTVKTLLTEPPPPRPTSSAPDVTQTASTAAHTLEKPVEPPRPVSKPEPAVITPRTYTVRTGDTLSRIASAVYSDSSQWRRIYDANRDTLKSEQDLRVGQIIRIPD